MRARSHTRRAVVNLAVQIACMLAAVFGCLMLGWILLVVAQRGLAALNVDFFTEPTPPPGVEGGGMGPAIVGTLVITATAACMGVPVGLLAGVFLAEYRGFRRASAAVRFAADLLMGVPSIITGIFVYALIVRTTGTFSAFAGAVALGIIMIPIITRTTEEMLRLVPDTTREAALAMGAPWWRLTLGVLFRAARAGLLTGVLLAVARVAGETAPLLFTSLNSPYWLSTDSVAAFGRSLDQPTANLTVTIFNQAMSPYGNWQRLAWGAALLITAGVLCTTILSRLILARRKGA
jgi:phosphate transport system permease protein